MLGEILASDQQVRIGDLRLAVHQFVSARDWYQFHSPKNLAMSIAIGAAAEIMEHFQWYTRKKEAAHLANPQVHAEVADELADVLISA